jgi:hypothetical protein
VRPAEAIDPALMRRYEVSCRVNQVKNEDAACAEPVVRESATGMLWTNFTAL